ncbi:MAG: PQQ-binding-like beta-propeller repeat protein, partial [Defluviitoga tunisiensis]
MKSKVKKNILVLIIFCLIIFSIAFVINVSFGNVSLKWKYETWGLINSSPAIGSDGTIYVGSGDYYLYAIQGESEGLADTPWPKFRNNNRNTG